MPDVVRPGIEEFTVTVHIHQVQAEPVAVDGSLGRNQEILVADGIGRLVRRVNSGAIGRIFRLLPRSVSDFRQGISGVTLLSPSG